jgi:hypothetical protein
VLGLGTSQTTTIYRGHRLGAPPGITFQQAKEEFPRPVPKECFIVGQKNIQMGDSGQQGSNKDEYNPPEIWLL